MLMQHPYEYSQETPNSDNAIKLFEDRWSSILPFTDVTVGYANLFADDRILRLLDEIGSLSGKQVLELGPLEAGHTSMLERAGADVVGIEANVDAFLRCLVVKNHLGLRAKFLHGDFQKGFGPPKQYDLVMASGVLYHMTDPMALLERVSEVTTKLYLWTHYFEPDITKWNSGVSPLVGTKWRPNETLEIARSGVTVRLVPQSYGQALTWGGFCGGPETESYWMYREDLLSYLRALGFQNIRIHSVDEMHPNGPALSLLACK